jgi:hypothetical protein
MKFPIAKKFDFELPSQSFTGKMYIQFDVPTNLGVSLGKGGRTLMGLPVTTVIC